MGNPYSFEVLFEAPFFDLPLVSQPGATPQQWEFEMPGYDVVLTPMYASATIYQNDGETEKQAYETLKEAFANVQDGDVIKLDWDVTLTDYLETPTIDGGVKFTLDFNGYTLDCGQKLIRLTNTGDELTFTDNGSKEKLGGLKAIGIGTAIGNKVIFDSGRYKFENYTTAEQMNAICVEDVTFEMADGKEFVDIAGAPDADDFNLIVGYKAFELTIGAGRFATFYADNNVALDAETPAGVGFYTITDIDDDRTLAYVTALTGVVEKETPMLVYNGTGDQLTVKIKVSPDAPDAENQYISPLENFQGTAVDNDFTGDDMLAYDYYALSGGKAFAPVYGAGTIAAHKCWLQFPKQQTPGSRSITIVFEETTAIDNSQLTIDNEAGAIYDLSGRKLNAAPKRKGVYVKDGKKVVR